MAETKVFGILSIICGILSIIFVMGYLGPILAVLGIIFAIIQKRKFPNKLATIGLVISIIGLALFLVLFLGAMFFIKSQFVM